MAERIGRLVSRWTIVNGLPMHAMVSVEPLPAAAPVVVLVHGAGLSHRYMMPTAVRLAPHVRVWVPDLPGYGLSADPGHILTIPELADALAAWMDAVGLEQAAFLGNSMGCQIIAHFAVRYPDRIERAILQGPTTDPQARTPWQQFWRWFRKMNREKPEQTPVNLREYRDAGLRRVARSVWHSWYDPIEDQLPHMHVPTLVVRGTGDTIVPQRWAEEVTRLLPLGQLVVVPGAMHTMNFQQPLELARVSLPFLQAGRQRQSTAQAA
ncbi:MAG: alpha/beta hydrolase [Chloroflexi bacterium]|nr:alpha/beta hydrolase [Chloroflexota bacterium]